MQCWLTIFQLLFRASIYHLIYSKNLEVPACNHHLKSWKITFTPTQFATTFKRFVKCSKYSWRDAITLAMNQWVFRIRCKEIHGLRKIHGACKYICNCFGWAVCSFDSTAVNIKSTINNSIIVSDDIWKLRYKKVRKHLLNKFACKLKYFQSSTLLYFMVSARFYLLMLIQKICNILDAC